MELMIFIVRETGDFLLPQRSATTASSALGGRSIPITLGLLTGWLAPAKRPMGCIEKLVDMFSLKLVGKASADPRH